MSQFEALQLQMLELQKKLNEAMEEKKQDQFTEYKGPNIKVTLIICNKIFITDTYTLFNKIETRFKS